MFRKVKSHITQCCNVQFKVKANFFKHSPIFSLFIVIYYTTTTKFIEIHILRNLKLYLTLILALKPLISLDVLSALLSSKQGCHTESSLKADIDAQKVNIDLTFIFH